MRLTKLSAGMLLVLLLIGALDAFADSGRDTKSEPIGSGISAVPKEESHIVAMYFHRRIRCQSCRAIETLSRSALKDELASGRVVFSLFALDDKENGQFIRDFKLSGPMLVIAEIQGNKVLRWNRLDQVWGLLDDEPEFLTYVAGATRAFMNTK